MAKFSDLPTACIMFMFVFVSVSLAVSLWTVVFSFLSWMSKGTDVKMAVKTPLMKAAHFGKVRQVRGLLNNGADVNAFDPEGCNALYYAAERGNTVTLKLLLEAGADVKAVDTNRKRYSLVVAASKGHDECVKILLQAGANVNARDDYHGTALTCAVSRGHEKCLKLLVEAGADVNFRSYVCTFFYEYEWYNIKSKCERYAAGSIKGGFILIPHAMK